MPGAPNPLAGSSFFVDRRWAPQYHQFERYLRRGARGSAGLVGKIALQPQFKWFGRWNANDKGGTALMFGRYATNWIRPPKGTRNGHPGRPSARSLAGDQYRR